MKRLVALAVGVLLSASLVVAASAAPADTPDTPKHQQGLKNLKKAAQTKLERDKKHHEAKKKGVMKRKLAKSEG